jgi:N-acetylglucosaminyldiphosphoundecaprenol N-acetyl-beta-D-mannosaminyltransferase
MVSFTEDSAVAEMPSPPSARPPVRKFGFVNGVRLDPVSPIDLAERVAQFLNRGSSHVVHFCAAHPTVLARKDAAYRDLLNRGDLNIPDGMAVAWALRLFGCPATRLAGSDAMSFLCEWGVQRMTAHYLFGGTPEVLARLKAKLEARFPGIRIVGAESPPFRPLTEEEWADAAERMRRAQADVVWIGLGAPKQDYAAERLRCLDAAPAILCVGAAFDFLSGAKKRAPRWMLSSGLEWLHRCLSEPKRLGGRYVLGNASFVAGIASDYLATARRPPP